MLTNKITLSTKVEKVLISTKFLNLTKASKYDGLSDDNTTFMGYPLEIDDSVEDLEIILSHSTRTTKPVEPETNEVKDDSGSL